jgi:hypothetical protein
MDDGYVIPGLNENWTFAGAKPMEWASGLVAALIFTELFISNTGKGMPLILMVMVTVPIVLATARKAYPDEERGLRNHMMSKLGLQPPDIPAPSQLQPVWSGLRVAELDSSCEFVKLGLDVILDPELQDEDAIKLRLLQGND